jgi:CRISPR type III-A-associated RAMP protein Csm5
VSALRYIRCPHLTIFCIEGNKLYRIDTEKLFDTLVKKEKISDFEDFVGKYVGNKDTLEQAVRKNNLLKEFLESIELNICNYYSSDYSPIDYNVPKDEKNIEAKWIELNSFIKTNNQPYIPGSSIKGAIKTAILYQWLMTDEGKKEINAFAAKLLDEKNKNGKLNEIKEFENKITAKVFGETLDGKRTPSSNFKIADSKPLKQENLFIGELGKRYNISIKTKEGQEFKPSFQEFIKTDTTVELDVCINQFALDWKGMYTDSYLYKILRDGDVSIILNAIKLFTKDFLEYELGRLKTVRDLTLYRSKLEKLNEQREKTQTDETLFCLGFGKSYLINSVALAIKKTNEKFYEKIIAKAFVHKKKKDKAKEHSKNIKKKLLLNFPTSFYFETSTNKPLGWAVLSFFKKEIVDTSSLKKNDSITGVLVERGMPSKVEILTTNGKQLCNVSNASKFEKEHSSLLIGQKCKIQIVVIKDNLIKDSKFIK